VAGLMPIGVFARATRLSIRALRNYDRSGLLRPAEVDPDTGYRRYAVGQFARAGLIRRLRDLEVPLSEIAEILDAGTPDLVRAAVERHRARVAAEADRLAGIAAELGTVLDEPSNALLVYERWREPSTVARIVLHTALSGLAGVLGPGFAELSARLAEQRVAVTGPAGCRYLGDDPDLEVELYLPVARRPRAAGRMSAGELPAAQLAATVHTGPYRGIDAAYRALGRWIAEHGRTLAGPAEEVYLVPPGVAAEELRTEVAWPIDTGS